MKYKEFYNKGFQIFDNVLDDKQINFYKDNLSKIYNFQVKKFGINKIKLIGEENTVRSPFLYNYEFSKLFLSDHTKTIVRDILGEYAILSLQNGIIVPPEKTHHQSFYHRDIIHQDFTSSKPLAINIYYCLDNYNKKNGGTTFIPYSHKDENFDIKRKEETPEIKAGSMILFNSMIYHKANSNTTNYSRSGINNMFSLPFIKQQINYPYCLKNKVKDKDSRRLLGYYSREFLSVEDFREYRLQRINNE